MQEQWLLVSPSRPHPNMTGYLTHKAIKQDLFVSLGIKDQSPQWQRYEGGCDYMCLLMRTIMLRDLILKPPNQQGPSPLTGI